MEDSTAPATEEDHHGDDERRRDDKPTDAKSQKPEPEPEEESENDDPTGERKCHITKDALHSQGL